MNCYRVKQTIMNWFDEGMSLSPNAENWLKTGDILEYNQFTRKYHKIVNGIQDLYLYRALEPEKVTTMPNFFEKVDIKNV